MTIEERIRALARADWIALSAAAVVGFAALVLVLLVRSALLRKTSLVFLVNSISILALIAVLAGFLELYSFASTRLIAGVLTQDSRLQDLPHDDLVLPISKNRTDRILLGETPPGLPYPGWLVHATGILLIPLAIITARKARARVGRELGAA